MRRATAAAAPPRAPKAPEACCPDAWWPSLLTLLHEGDPGLLDFSGVV